MAEKIEWEKYIIPAGIVVAGYLILKNLNLFGGSPAAANSAGITSSTASGVASSLATAKASGDFATISASQAAGIANNIYTAGVADPVDMDAIQNQVIQANTLTDLLLIIQAFGTKQAGGAACSIFGGFVSAVCGTYDLASWIRANLDPSHIQTINTYLSGQNINYQF
jgi:hypothetical protein